MTKAIFWIQIAINFLLAFAVGFLAVEQQKIKSAVEYIRLEQISAQTAFFRED